MNVMILCFWYDHDQGNKQQVFCTRDAYSWSDSCVATSPVMLRWLCDSPRTGCAQRTKIYVCGTNKQ